MTSVNKATARANFDGIEDQSTRALPIVQEQIPIHLPYLYLQTRKGPLTPQLVSSTAMLQMYHADSFDETKKYFSHQTLAAQICNGYGNAVMIKRVVSDTAKVSRLVLRCEIVEAEFDKYERDADDNVTYASDGTPNTDSSTQVEGYNIRWSVAPVDEADAGDIKTVTPGTLAGKTGAESTIYPIMEFEAAHVGEYGNGVGFRLSYPHAKTSNPADRFTTEDQKAALFRMQYVERPSADRSPQVVTTLNAERSLDFSFKNGIVNTKTNMTYGTGKLVTEWQDFTKGYVPRFGPMGKVKVYENNLNTILTQFMTAEILAGVFSPDDRFELNPFTGLNYEGQRYESVRMASDTIAFNTATTHYLEGGHDGTVSEAELDTLTRNECTNTWDNVDYPLLDRLKYPFSAMYDTGFSVDTKKAMLNTLGRRPDFHVAVCDQDMSAPDNSVSESTSVGTMLRAAARLTPESTVHGTEVCRAVVVRGVGKSTRSLYGRRVSLIMDLIAKRAAYWGAGAGRAKSAKAYDQSPANRVTELETVTNSWVPDTVKDKHWELGVNYVQSANRHDLFWPAFQTVYSDDTSILNSDLLMQIMVDVTKRADQTWTHLSGDTKLTRAQFITKSDKLFTDNVVGRYDGRVVIQANTKFTPADDIRGYSWTMDIAVYGNNMKTVGQYNIIARRRSDLEA